MRYRLLRCSTEMMESLMKPVSNHVGEAPLHTAKVPDAEEQEGTSDRDGKPGRLGLERWLAAEDRPPEEARNPRGPGGPDGKKVNWNQWNPTQGTSEEGT